MAEVNDKNLTGEGLAALWELIKAEDKAVADIANSKANVVTGTYTGNGAASRTISLGFTPKAVVLNIVSDDNGLNGYVYKGNTVFAYTAAAIYGNPFKFDSGTILEVVDGGFTVYVGTNTSYRAGTNLSNKVFSYIAIA